MNTNARGHPHGRFDHRGVVPKTGENMSTGSRRHRPGSARRAGRPARRAGCVRRADPRPRVGLRRHRAVSTLSESAGSPNSVTFGQLDGHLYAAQNGGVVGTGARPTRPARHRAHQPRRRGHDGCDRGRRRHAEGAQRPRVRARRPPVLHRPVRGLRPREQAGDQPALRARCRRRRGADRAAALVHERARIHDRRSAGVGRVLQPRRSACSRTASGASCACCPRTTSPTGSTWPPTADCSSRRSSSHGITVVSPDGEVLDTSTRRRRPPVELLLRRQALWVTDFGVDWTDGSGSGRLWRVETDAVGRPPFAGKI